MKHYRLFHRATHEWRDAWANSAQEACESVGWLIGDVWVREETYGEHANGWKNVTKREEEQSAKEHTATG